MVRIFKTDVSSAVQEYAIIQILKNTFPHSTINFDLEDCDNILRVEAIGVQSADIVRQVHTLGYQCSEID
ncbi:hypothetical protein [Flavobacterium sp. JP2137]|uniref:hypothetical protein n=1 Tax=Flavobacterium sp. JP2137 TaxID=3414510 RepID=UPI003D2FDA06